MKKIIMSKPNISEGRDPAIVNQVTEAIRLVEGVTLVDFSSDPDHHRSVFSYLGSPEAVLEASKAMADTAFALIDMTGHSGEHPRLGAVDVVPFIPVRGVDKEETVEIARQFGHYVGELGVPVYYYEDAATAPERTSLPAIRKGEYEGLAEKLRDPVWQPDEGPASFNQKSGAMVTGSRFPLIAFNANLNTTNLEVAQQIAKAVRHISGGYHYVRAMGFALEDRGMVQVSMNLTNYTKTPIPRVLETIRREADRYGVSIAETEIIGSIPLAALEEVVRFYLQTHTFSADQVLETALIE